MLAISRRPGISLGLRFESIYHGINLLNLSFGAVHYGLGIHKNIILGGENYVNVDVS